ncbi:DUF1983 domain-containing protein [Vibrio fortis]|uniref:phage tail tip fiber protein n=1 Tax=Vibrio fortis TaxID=212667 RepID=UPI0038CDC712
MSNWFSSTSINIQQADYATKLNTDSSQNDVPVIYGRSGAIGAHRVFKEVVNSGKDNDLLTVIYTLGEGEIHAIEQLYIDNQPLFKNERNYKNGTIGQNDLADNFKNHVQVQISTGSETNPFRFSMAEQNSDGRWSSAHRLYGRAAICLKIKLDPWKGVIKNDGFNITAVVKGKLIHDIRYDNNPYGYESGGKDFGRNPALCLYDYMTNTRYGAGIHPNDIDTSSFILAANWCDKNNIHCDGVVNQGQSYKKNMDELRQSFDAHLTDYNGAIYCVIDSPAAVAFDFNESNLTGRAKIKHQAVEKYFNKLEVTWFSPDKEYKKDTICYPPRDTDPSIVKDGKVITQRVDLPFTKEKYAMDFLASKAIMKSKFADVIEFSSNIDGFMCNVHDVVTITSPELKLNKRAFRITELKRNITGSKAGTVDFKATEYDEAVYYSSWQGVSRPHRPVDLTVKPVTDLKFQFVEASDSFTGLLTWNQNQAKVREYNVFFKRTAEPDSSFRYFDTVKDKKCIIANLQNGYYDFEVVSVDLFGISSASTYVRNIDLKDDTVFPEVTGLTVNSTGRDFSFQWDDMSTAEVDTIDTSLALGNKKVSAFFKAYEVQVKVAGLLIHTALVTDPKFTYTYEQNVENGITRELDVEVRILGKAGAQSNTPATVRAKNEQNQAPQGINVDSAPASMFIGFDAPTEPDYQGTEIHWSVDRDFTPSPATLLADLQGSNFFTKVTNSDEVYFIKLASYDCFGRDSMLFTKAYELSTKSAESILKEIGEEHLAKELADVISGKADQLTVDETTTGLNEKADQALADAEAAKQQAKQEAAKALKQATEQSQADLAIAKAELKEYTDQKEVDLTPVNAHINAVEKALSDADKAVTTKINTAQAKANQNASDINAIEKSVADNEQATATKFEQVKAETEAHADSKANAALTGAKAHTTAELTKEQTARTTADIALSTLIEQVTAKANKNTADIKSTSTALATKEEQLASRIDSVTATANSKATPAQAQAMADKAEADAKVDAAKDAQEKATKALSDAKKDAANKANSAESKAKVAAALDAKNKADAALATARTDATNKANKAKIDAINAARAHTDSSVNTERTARTTADTALGKRVDSVNAKTDKATADIKTTNTVLATKEQALAKRISTLDSATSYSLAEINSREANWDFKLGMHNWTKHSSITHVTDPDEGDCIKLTSSQWPKNDYFIPVNPENVYEISFRIKQQIINGAKGSYLGVICYDKDKREINTSPRSPDTKPYTGTYTYCGKPGGNTPSEWTTFRGKITGINGYSHNSFRPDTCFIKIMFIANYSGGKGEARVSWVDFKDVTERNETAARISTVEKAVTDKDTAMASRVTSMETSVKADSKAKADAALAAAKVWSTKDAANKANAAKAQAVVDSAATAQAKATKALNDAKADATAKANSAESKAKVAAATDAKKKADAALAAAKTDAQNKATKALNDAKAYANTKKTEAIHHINSKFNEAVKLVNDKDSAQATKISNLESVTNNVKTSGFANKKTITVGGDADKYYPVYFKGGNQNLARRIVVSRQYSETAPPTWHTASHKGGLLLDLTANFGGWGGQTYHWNINKIQQCYTTMFGGANNAVYQMYFCVWLRGGGAVYHVYQEVDCPIHVGTNTGERLYLSVQGTRRYEQFVDAPRTAAWSDAEINARLMGKKEYAGLSKVENLTADEIRLPVRNELKANIATVNKTITDKNSAMSSRVNTVTATANSAKAKVDTTASALATLDGKVKATYGVRVDSKGKVAGFGLSNDGKTSAFSINADKFMVYNGKFDQPVFAIKDGVSVLNRAMIGELDASNIKAGSISASHLSVDAITANSGIIQDGAITNAKIGNVLQSHNFAEKDGKPTQGWKIDKSGTLKVADLIAGGKIYSPEIHGGVIYGAQYIMNADGKEPLRFTDCNGYQGMVYLFSKDHSSSKVNGSPSAAKALWGSVMPFASYNYTASGKEYVGGKDTWKLFTRYQGPAINPLMKVEGWFNGYGDTSSTDSNVAPKQCNWIKVRMITANSKGQYLWDTSVKTIQLGSRTIKKFGSYSGHHASAKPGAGSAGSSEHYFTHGGRKVRIRVYYQWAWKLDRRTGKKGAKTASWWAYPNPQRFVAEIVESGNALTHNNAAASGLKAYGHVESGTAGHCRVTIWDSNNRY